MGVFNEEYVVVRRGLNPGDPSEITINCPDKVGLGCDLARIVFEFGLSVTKGGTLFASFLHDRDTSAIEDIRIHGFKRSYCEKHNSDGTRFYISELTKTRPIISGQREYIGVCFHWKITQQEITLGSIRARLS